MIPRRLLAVLLTALIGCSPPEGDDPSEPDRTGPRISADVIYGHKFGMALTLDVEE